jgi:hypothetical protein
MRWLTSIRNKYNGNEKAVNDKPARNAHQALRQFNIAEAVEKETLLTEACCRSSMKTNGTFHSRYESWVRSY